MLDRYKQQQQKKKKQTTQTPPKNRVQVISTAEPCVFGDWF